MKKILLFLLLLPSLVLAGTNDQLPDASRTDWLFVQQTWGGGASTRGAITAQMIIDLIVADDIDGLAAAVSGNADVIASFKDAATVISAIDTYLGGAGWRADLSALVTANSAKVGITVDQANAIIANTAKVTYPGPELTTDELAAMQGANAPSAANPLATQNDIAAAGGGDITGVTAGAGLSGGGLTGDVVLSLNDTAITPGSYTNVNITVDQQGRVTAVSNGTDNTGTDDQTAAEVLVSDAGANYTATDVEGVLAEIAPQLGGGGTDDQQVTDFTLTGDSLTLTLESDSGGQKTVDLSGYATDSDLIGKANLDSPTFTGTVTAPSFATSAIDGDRVQILPENTTRTPGVGEESIYNEAGQVRIAENGVEYDLIHSGDTVFAPALGVDDNYVTDAEKVIVGNTSGTNTGDQVIPVSGVDFDPLGTDNSTSVTIGTANGLSITGQQINMSAATNITPGAATAAQITALEAVDTESEIEAMIFDADNTGDLTTTGTVTAGAFSSTAADGSRSQIYQENTSYTPGAGEESIYNEAGQLKVAENGVEYDIVHSGDIYRTKSFAISGATTDDDFLIWKAPAALTITAINGVLSSGMNVVGGLDECDSNGANCAAVDADITFDGLNDADDGALSNGSIDSGDWVRWHTTSVSSPGFLTVTISYTVD